MRLRSNKGACFKFKAILGRLLVWYFKRVSQIILNRLLLLKMHYFCLVFLCKLYNISISFLQFLSIYVLFISFIYMKTPHVGFSSPDDTMGSRAQLKVSYIYIYAKYGKADFAKIKGDDVSLNS